MKLSEIYSQKIDHLKTVKFGESEIKVKLFMQDEAEAFGEMVLDETRIDEFLAKSVFEGEKSLFDDGKIGIFKNMPNAHKRDLMKAITDANGGSSSFEEKKSD